jgi:quercetin dioxygenase-like cupin family protein
MPFINFNERKKVKIWEGITARLFHSEKITFGHVTLEEGAIVSEHSHIHEQWTHMIEGEMMFDVNGEKKLLIPGMAAFIPSNVRHSAVAVTTCKVIDCFLPVREDFVEMEKKQ